MMFPKQESQPPMHRSCKTKGQSKPFFQVISLRNSVPETKLIMQLPCNAQFSLSNSVSSQETFLSLLVSLIVDNKQPWHSHILIQQNHYVSQQDHFYILYLGPKISKLSEVIVTEIGNKICEWVLRHHRIGTTLAFSPDPCAEGTVVEAERL